MTAEAKDEGSTPLQRLVEAGNDLIAQGMSQCERDDPRKTAYAIEFEKAGAFRRLTIESRPEQTSIEFELVGASDELQVFRYDLRRAPAERH